MKRKINKRTGKCANCSNKKSKKDGFLKKTIAGNEVYVCNMCGYINSLSIFTEFIDIKNQNLIFLQTIKKGKR